jgi:hypothetical protein
MPDETTPDETAPDESRDAAAPAETAWERRRRLAAVFGDVLPEGTRDDRDDSGGDEARGEEWLRRQVPPHHG